MKRQRFFFAALLLFMLFAAETLLAWGATGHRVVGQIAENHLSDVSRLELDALMGHEGLPRASTWADEIKSDPAWDHAFPWHYISVNDDESFETAERNPDGDILTALEHYTAVLKDRSAPEEERRNAVRFLTHLIGDLHQPLHVGRREDRGGNRIDVEWMREESNLHRVWDTDMINKEGFSFTEYADMIDHPTAEQIRTWQSTGFLVWAQESFDLRAQVYEIEDGDLGWEYKYRNKEAIERRMLQAGIRLAGLLNEIFGMPTGETP